MKNFAKKDVDQMELEMEVTLEKIDSTMNLRRAMKNHSEEKVIKYDAQGNIIENRTTKFECLDARVQDGYHYMTILQEHRIIGSQLVIVVTFSIIYYNFLLKIKSIATKKYITTISWGSEDDLASFVVLPYGWIEDVVKETNYALEKKYNEFLGN